MQGSMGSNRSVGCGGGGRQIPGDLVAKPPEAAASRATEVAAPLDKVVSQRISAGMWGLSPSGHPWDSRPLGLHSHGPDNVAR